MKINFMNCREYREIIAAHVDGVLSFEDNRQAQAHVDECATCNRLLVWERSAQKAIKPHLAVIPPPRGLEERVLGNLARKGQSREMLSWIYFSPRLVVSFALLAVVVLATILWRNQSHEEFLSVALDQYRTMLAKGPEASGHGDLSTPAARRLDLSPWGYRLAANRVSQVKGRERRLSLFEGQANEYVLAQEIDRADLSPPRDIVITRAEHREFLSYSQGGVNLVAWKDEDLLCVLTSNIPIEKLMVLAREITVRS